MITIAATDKVLENRFNAISLFDCESPIDEFFELTSFNSDLKDKFLRYKFLLLELCKRVQNMCEIIQMVLPLDPGLDVCRELIDLLSLIGFNERMESNSGEPYYKTHYDEFISDMHLLYSKCEEVIDRNISIVERMRP
jgi:hypothetical protein